MMKKFIKWLFIITLIAVSVTLIGVGLYISSIYVNAKNTDINEEVLTSSTLSLNIYDSTNKPIKESNAVNHAYASIDSLQPYTINAFISIEDKTFYEHNGINPKRIVKAGINNIKSHSLKEGASTITQQLIKNTQLSNEKTYSRKIKEIAFEKKAALYGSYDPEGSGLQMSDLYDVYHVKTEKTPDTFFPADITD